MVAIPVTRSISLDSEELQESFTRAGGPGGQHVNTTDSAVLLRFDVATSPNLPDAVKHRLAILAGSRLTRDGVIVIEAQRFRVFEQNRADALERLGELIRAATIVPKPRRPTRPARPPPPRPGFPPPRPPSASNPRAGRWG